MKRYEIIRHTSDYVEVLKRYRFKLQAYVWCLLKDLVYTNGKRLFLDPCIQIMEVEDDFL